MSDPETDTTIVYHFTSRAALRDIMASGYIGTSDSMIGSRLPKGELRAAPVGPGVGPPVVWVTDQDGHAGNVDSLAHGLAVAGHQDVGHGFADADAFARVEVRFTLEIPTEEAVPWKDFADDSPIHPRWRRRLEAFPHRPDWWGVVGRPIPFTEWRLISVGRGVWTPYFVPDVPLVRPLPGLPPATPTEEPS